MIILNLALPERTCYEPLASTHPDTQGAALLDAYQSGRFAWGPVPMRTQLPREDGYPVAIATSGEQVIVQPVRAAPRRVEISVEPIDDELDTLVGVLKSGLAEGGCVAVIRNTVARVQQTARYLELHLPDTEVMVVHSRFLGVDRARLEKRLIELFGPDGSVRRREQRIVVVASQVVEQSLDLDFDLLVTDLAPVDLILQRIGRLHRHDRGQARAARLRSARCLIAGVDWTLAPPDPCRGSKVVYEAATLYRSLAVLQPKLAGEPLVVPTDIAPLVQDAYGGQLLGPPSWQPAMQQADAQAAKRADDRRDKADTFRLGAPRGRDRVIFGWVAAGVGDVDDDPKGVAQVRDGRPGLEVIVVQQDAQGGYLTPSWIGTGSKTQIPTDLQVPRQLSRLVAACTLQLPPMMCLPAFEGAVISSLEQTYLPGWQQTHLLAGQLVLVLDDDARAELAGFSLSYHQRYGLEYRRER